MTMKKIICAAAAMCMLQAIPLNAAAETAEPVNGYDINRNGKATINPQLYLLGILPTMVEHTTVSRNAVQLLEDTYTDKLLRTQIHRSVEAAKSSESGKALCLTSGSRLGEEYMELAEAIHKSF